MNQCKKTISSKKFGDQLANEIFKRELFKMLHNKFKN
jgi:hypothetical protein